ncbi:MAG: hypothetical protein Q4F32_09450, partial [Eubacteriales bacterium]|nr:hypothetical protein [Eubacteriales bacterium]
DESDTASSFVCAGAAVFAPELPPGEDDKTGTALSPIVLLIFMMQEWQQSMRNTSHAKSRMTLKTFRTFLMEFSLTSKSILLI